MQLLWTNLAGWRVAALLCHRLPNSSVRARKLALAGGARYSAVIRRRRAPSGANLDQVLTVCTFQILGLWLVPHAIFLDVPHSNCWHLAWFLFHGYACKFLLPHISVHMASAWVRQAVSRTSEFLSCVLLFPGLFEAMLWSSTAVLRALAVGRVLLLMFDADLCHALQSRTAARLGRSWPAHALAAVGIAIFHLPGKWLIVLWMLFASLPFADLWLTWWLKPSPEPNVVLLVEREESLANSIFSFYPGRCLQIAQLSLYERIALRLNLQRKGYTPVAIDRNELVEKFLSELLLFGLEDPHLYTPPACVYRVWGRWYIWHAPWVVSKVVVMF